ncbi:hypothetical protein, partial [Allomesorhizobium camelthorni]
CAIGRICPYEKRPSQFLVAAGAFCQIRFFGFLLRNSFDIGLNADGGRWFQKKIRERRTFSNRVRQKEKGGIAAALSVCIA